MKLINYKDKYIKYKNKYLEIKNIIQKGGIDCNNYRVFKNILGTCWMVDILMMICFGDATKYDIESMLKIIKDDVEKLIKSKIESVFISADKRGFGISQKRVQDMGFELELVSSQDRKKYISNVKSNSRVIFIGDSFTDELALCEADLSFTPANAHLIAKKASNYKLKAKGGYGAVSEVCFLLNRYLKENSHS